jgi:acyl-CoA synthetase (NDP forming)
MRNITPLVAPRSIAVIGASANPTKSGGVLFDNLLKGNFQGPLYPINRTAKEIMGKTAYPSLADVPEKVDLVYIVLPQQHVEDAVKQCVAAGARAGCIITAGFSEAGPKGRGDEERLREIARTSGLLLAGPNTIGMVNAEVGMMGSFVNFPRWKDGGVSFFGPRALPISNGRAATSSSAKFRNLRSASCCAESWSRANTRRSRRLQPFLYLLIRGLDPCTRR